MANLDRPNGFRPYPDSIQVTLWPVAAAQTIAVGDMVLLDAAGRIAIAGTGANEVCGVAATPVTASSAGDDIWVYDSPDQMFEAQYGGTTGGALADPYTTATAAQCFDLTGTTGIQEIDEDNSTDDLFRVVKRGYDPATGDLTELDVNARMIIRINESEHQLARAT